eukprot:COSAG02_NODE_3282_length_7020_cov_13.269614_6_plen_418_part_00
MPLRFTTGTGGETVFTIEQNDQCISAGAPAPPVNNCADVVCPQATGVCKVAGSCRQETGDCGAETNAPENTPCDDGDVTTRDDVCSWGVCGGIDRCMGVTCDPPSSDCKVAGECVPTTGECSEETNAVDGTDCDDGDSTTNSDMCTAGECAGTTSRPPPSPPPTSIQSTVEGQIRLDATMEDVEADRITFEMSFKEAMVQQFRSNGVDITPAEVTVTDITGGSVIVSYSVVVTCGEPDCTIAEEANNAVLTAAESGSFTVGEFSSEGSSMLPPPPPPPVTLPLPPPSPPCRDAEDPSSFCGPGTIFNGDSTAPLCVPSESPNVPSPPPPCRDAEDPSSFCGAGTIFNGDSTAPLCMPSECPNVPSPPPPPRSPPGFCTLDVAGVAEAAAERDVSTRLLSLAECLPSRRMIAFRVRSN